ncbi:MAG: SDR family oxidoreductase [Patescibacteria group bacterium]
MLLNNKTVVITGGSGGIGFALAKALIAKGARVFSFDKVKPKERIANFTHITVDITKPATIKRGFKKISPPIDILINNAGVMRRGKILEASEDDFDLLFGINLRGSWLVLKYAQPYLRKRPVVVQMSSRHGLALPQDPALYGLTKRCVKDLADVVQATHPAWNIKVVCPGPIDTPLTWTGVGAAERPKKRKLVRPPEHIAAKIVALLESDKKTILFDAKKWDEVILD